MANFAVEMRSPKLVRKLPFPVAEVRLLDLGQENPAWNEQQVDRFQKVIFDTAVAPDVQGSKQRARWRSWNSAISSTPIAKGGGAKPK